MKIPESRFRSKTEAAYNTILFYLKARGEIEGYEYEPKPPKILHSMGRGRTYQPDFLVYYKGSCRVYVEIKGGYIREDAQLKFEWAASKYINEEFQMIQFKNGVWTLIRHYKNGVSVLVKKKRKGIKK